ncbi:similar to Saccharomyces cerevisiae YDL123W SNA4 Protein of unknown function, localized to the vacuolar outer membrane [Maudiozyma saulgeensis]|uniref:Uncharacterized protein n=1 Tax=Maudiozyma saulgeensis TaxID=1789683 RepID=A0A1X7QY77_9SACH|nr:similar to Saccharomyces cerevisiae YDL123W SNA4 Protein of unknown function, localized to the vacuolar outer membrane [Kazachstania saulgeensis]
MCVYVCCSVSDFILYIVAFFFPPVAVLLRSGFCSKDFLLNILLTLCGFVPGMIHAFYYITVTSPLRRDVEYVYFYQNGWQDNEGQAESNRENQDMRRPLLSESNYQERTRPTDNKIQTSQPPAYSE